MENISNDFTTSTRNRWPMPGNGILSGLMLGMEAPGPDDANTQFHSLWAQAIHNAVRNRQRNNSKILEDPTSNQSPSFDNADLGIQWRGLASGAGFGSVQSAGAGLWPQFGFPSASAPIQSAPSFGLDLARFQAPAGANDRAPALSQPAIRPTTPMLDQSSSPLGFVPVGYDETAARPWWAPPSILDEWEKHFKRGNEGLYNFLFRSRSFGGGERRDEEECERRYSDELRRCAIRYPDMVSKDYYLGCRDRATQRWKTCLKNGYPDGPGEMYEWGDDDEETWRNYGR